MCKVIRSVFIKMLITLSFATIAGGNEQGFVEIIESTKRFSVTAGSKPEFIKFEINSANETLYWLHCFAGNDAALDKLSSETDINFVAPFACRLSQEDEVYSEITLLAEIPRSSYWHSRGRFSIRDLENGCGDGTEFGKVRNFSLRGFQLVLEITNITRVDGNAHFDFMVSVKNAPGATTTNAKPSTAIPSRWRNGHCT